LLTKLFIFLSFQLLVFGGCLFPQNDYYYQKKVDGIYNYNYKNNIKTILFYCSGNKTSQPELELNSSDKLILSFDDIDADIKTYNYSITYCDPYWNPIEVPQFFYLEGINNGYITNYQMSFNTLTKYTHYEIQIPNDELKIKLSGNYIINVYQDGDINNIVFSRRFIVWENIVEINGQIKQAINTELMEKAHQLDFYINTGSFKINNPYTDIKIIAKQNGRWDNVLTDFKINNINNKIIKFTPNNISDNNYFLAGNEYRYLDIRDILSNNENVSNKYINENQYYINLLPDNLRYNQPYSSTYDINGEKLILRKNSFYPDLEEEYINVTFTLNTQQPYKNGNIYVFGSISDWDYKEYNKMKYDSNKKCYTITMLLKQGYYNYLYMLLPNNSNIGTTEYTEGNFWQTQNVYTIYVYYREEGKQYYRIIGLKKI